MIKAIAATFVCFQHAIGTGMVSGYLLALSRIAVPLFMIITGYLYSSVVKKGHQIQQIKRYTIIAFEMFFLFLLYECGLHTVRHDLLPFLQEKFSWPRIVEFLFINRPFAADHSWYMLAMIYTLVLAFLLPEMTRNQLARRFLIISLLLSHLLLGKYSILFFGKECDSLLTRNAWFVGIPFFLLGVEIKEYMSKEKQEKGNRFLILTILFSVLCLIERALLIKFQINAPNDFYIFTAPLAISVFCLIISKRTKIKESWMTRFGQRYSLVFYIIHPLFVKLEVRFFDMNSPWQYLGFLSVFLISYIFAVAYQKTKEIVLPLIKERG